MKHQSRISRSKAFTEGTFSNIRCQWVKFIKFCIYFGLAALPASVTVLSWYAQYLTDSHKSHSSIISYLSGVKKLHEVTGFSMVSFSGYLFKLTLLGIRRRNQHIVKRSQPIMPAILQYIYLQLDHSKPEDAVFWCACILAFSLLFRKFNLLPDTAQGFDAAKQLRRCDCVFTKNNNVVVGIRWAKNEQFWHELLTFPLPFMQGSNLCPVTALTNMFSLVRAGPDSHLFSFSDSSSLTYRKFQEKLRSCLTNCPGTSGLLYSSHSFRRGGTTFAFLSGVPL